MIRKKKHKSAHVIHKQRHWRHAFPAPVVSSCVDEGPWARWPGCASARVENSTVGGPEAGAKAGWRPQPPSRSPSPPITFAADVQFNVNANARASFVVLRPTVVRPIGTKGMTTPYILFLFLFDEYVFSKSLWPFCKFGDLALSNAPVSSNYTSFKWLIGFKWRVWRLVRDGF